MQPAMLAHMRFSLAPPCRRLVRLDHSMRAMASKASVERTFHKKENDEKRMAAPGLIGKTVWVVGGVGVIGRGICYGLLKAGATVIINSSSEKRLIQMQKDLNHPKRLIGLVGTMRPAGAESLVEKAVVALSASGHTLSHVVAHSGVRWWAGKSQIHETLFADALINSNENGMWECGAQELGVLPELHYAAARLLIPHLPDSPEASYTFVTGGAGEQRSILSQVNTHGVWGLSAALREQYHDASLRIVEIRVNLRIDRPARERALDPRARPLSADIGEICAGMAAGSDALVPARGFYPLDKTGDVLVTKMMYPCPSIVDDIPMLWHFDGK